MTTSETNTYDPENIRLRNFLMPVQGLRTVVTSQGPTCSAVWR